MDEISDKHSDNAQRRTKPEDQGPASPKKIADIYAKGKEIIPRKEWLHSEHQENQMPEDRHDNGRGRYDNDVPEKSWLRGGRRGGEDRPTFDRGKYDLGDKPDRRAAGGSPNTASGADMPKSPWSAAYRKPSFSRT